jgi:hypothetical protein
MTAQRTSNTDINRALGRLEGAMDALVTAAAATHTDVSVLSGHVAGLRRDVQDLQEQMKPVIEQTQWLKEKRAQGVGALAVLSVTLAGLASAAGAFGGHIWRAVTGTEA